MYDNMFETLDNEISDMLADIGEHELYEIWRHGENFTPPDPEMVELWYTPSDSDLDPDKNQGRAISMWFDEIILPELRKREAEAEYGV
ncbi:hypothetical protein DRH14_04450 [Candidatus Shapirobacteria bacterium]|nr:MAG: hypothetical protein DRH14_04450 [Candidatus Shapirobacteria bacterium]